MKSENGEQLRKLCAQAVKEPDPEKLLEEVAKIDKLLEEAELSSHSKAIGKKP